jgi:RNA methyltransferase, TrmH family
MLTKSEIKRLRSLSEPRERRARGLYVVEGEKVISELLSEGLRFQELYHTPDWKAPHCAAVPEAVCLSPEEMARISHFPTPSSVLAVGAIPETSLAPGALDTGWTLALDGIQDPGNTGTLIRIADWFGMDRVLLSLNGADPFSQKAINASMGSFARVELHRCALEECLAEARAPIIGCSLDGTPLGKLHRPDAGIIVIGSEGRGLSEGVSARLTHRVTIPRLGRAESLNAAVAAGIVCAHLRGIGLPA